MRSPRMCALAVLIAGVGGASAVAMPGLGAIMTVQAEAVHALHARSMKNPSSYIVVRRAVPTRSSGDDGTVRFSMPGMMGGDPHAGSVSVAGLIAVPSNARAGDPAFAEPEDVYEDEWVYSDDGDTSRTTGMVFSDSVELGYTTLRRPETARRGEGARGRHRHRVSTVTEFGANDLHRSAQLEFSEAAQPRLSGQDDAWRRAQLRFHEATVTPAVERGSDGLRHERTGPARGSGETAHRRGPDRR